MSKKIILAIFTSIALLTPVFAQISPTTPNGINKTQKTTRPNHNSAEAFCKKGDFNSSFEEYETAIECYDKALKLKPDYAEAYYGRAMAKSNLGKNKDAIDDYTSAIELSPKYAKAYYGRGLSENTLLKTDEALEDFNKAIELNPAYSEAYCRRGAIEDTLGKFDEAEKDFDKALELNPKYIEASFFKNKIQHRRMTFEKVIQACNKAIESDPNDIKSYFARANIRKRLGKNKEAIEDYNKIIELNPKYTDAYYCRGIIEAELGMTKEANIDFSKAVELAPESKKQYYAKSSDEYVMGEITSKQMEMVSESYHENAFHYIEQGQNKIALKNFNIALELNPNNIKAQNDLKYLLAQPDKNGKISTESFPSRKALPPEDKYKYICNSQVSRPMEYENDEDWNCEADRYKLKNPALLPIIRLKDDDKVDEKVYGYMNKKGKIVIQPKFTFADDFYEGLARVYVGGTRCMGRYSNDMYDTKYFYGGKYGYITKRGKFKIKPQFEYASRFGEGLAAVKINDKYGYINKKGKIIIQPQFYCAGEFEAGQAPVCMDEKTDKRTLIDKTGKPAPKDANYDRVHRFSEGLAVVEKDGKMGAINEKRELVIDIKYDYLSPFREGLAVAGTGSQYGYIDKTGKPAFEEKFSRACPFSEGLAAVEAEGETKEVNGLKFYLVKKCGYIDKTGKFVIGPEKMDWNYSFVNGLAPVNMYSKLEGEWIYMGKTGKFVYLDPSPDVIINLTDNDSLAYIAKYSGGNEDLPVYVPKMTEKIRQNLKISSFWKRKISVIFQIDSKGNILEKSLLVYKSSKNKNFDNKFTDIISKSAPFGEPHLNCTNWGKTIQVNYENRLHKLKQNKKPGFTLLEKSL